MPDFKNYDIPYAQKTMADTFFNSFQPRKLATVFCEI